MVKNATTSIEGYYVASDGSVKQGLIRVVDGIISEVSAPTGSAEHTFNSNFTIYPGFIDIHVHAREYPLPDVASDDARVRHADQLAKETYESFCAAAINGGVTAFADMPNNPIPPCDDASYRAKLVLADGRCTIDHVLYALITKDSEPFGNRPYKIYTHDFSHEELDTTLERYAGCFVAAHCESRDIIARRPERPASAEVADIAKMLDLAERYSLRLHVSHVSTRAGLELVLGMKNAGSDVTCETTPTYLFWSDERKMSSARHAWLTMKPPIRSEEDRRRLLVGIEDGDIDILATDHAPHTHKDKENGAFGIPLEDHYTNFVGWLMQHGLSRRRIIDVCSVAPGMFMHRFTGERFGRIEPGYVASFTVTERLPAMEFREKGGYMPVRTRCDWSPFDGVKLGNDYILHAHEVFVRGVRMRGAVNAR